MSEICRQCKNRLTNQGVCNKCRKRKQPEPSSSSSNKSKPKEVEEEFHQIPAFDLFVREVVDQMTEIHGVTAEEASDIATKNWAEFGYQWCFDSLKSSLQRRDPHISIPKFEEIKITAPEESYPRSTAFSCFVSEEMDRIGMGDKNSGVTCHETYGLALKKWYKFGFQWCVDSLIATSAIDTEALMSSPLYQLRGYFEH